MLKDYKKPFFILLNSFVLAACVSSAEVNQQSEHNYTQEINKMKVRGKIDYSSTTAKRIHSIFEKWCLMRIVKITLICLSNGK